MAGSANLLIQGKILTPTATLIGGDVLVNGDTGKISCVGCNCSDSPDAKGATTITCPDGVVSPGLINAHDHLGYNQTPPISHPQKFDHRNAWRSLWPASYYPLNVDQRVQSWSELRQVLSGTTTIASNLGVIGFARNLESNPDLEEGLHPSAKVDFATFPLGDIGDKTTHEKSCNYPSIVQPAELTGFQCFLPHVSEGVDQAAHNEFECLSGQRPAPGVDVTGHKSTFIHAVALLNKDADIVKKTDMSIVWSPRSNISLYGNTAPVTRYRAKHINIALSSDWTPSGSINLLRELQCADSLNKKNFNNTFSDYDLWMMVTANAAKATHTYPQIGILKRDSFADIAIYDGRKAGLRHYRAIIDANVQDVALVLRGGTPLYGDEAVVNAIPAGGASNCERFPATMPACVSGKSVCINNETHWAYMFSDLEKANQGLYGLVFCSAPTDEPTCTPSRSTPISGISGCGVYDGIPKSGDKDGDGISDTLDNCPDIFNPVRPVDYYANGSQCIQLDICH
jgi:cytosine/adenosine deaminase-related metal-dependent hydrolase